MNYPPYNIVFSDDEQNLEIFELLEKVILPLPVLECLDYFGINDFQTYRHNLMVFVVSVLLVKILLLEYEELGRSTITGSSHDIGKICLPLEILKKSSPLTKKELRLLRHHSVTGYVLLTHFLGDQDSPIAKLARDHHERKDGSGYPRGIEQTNKMVEIVAVSDVYDALLMPRSYRPFSFDNRTALEEMQRMAERGEIGWDILKALIAQNRISKPNYQDICISKIKRCQAPRGNLYGVIVEDE
jgi:HD-GYP domain-containing protein (c-di-GMP phosphodiesterase class II)